MKANLPFALITASTLFCVTPVAQAFLVTGWHSFNNTSGNEVADFTVPGFSGIVTKSGGSGNTGGSNDTFYGDSSFPLPSSAPIGDGSLRILGSNSTFFTITNNSGTTHPLDKLYFDAAVTGDNPSIIIAVSYQYGTLMPAGIFIPLASFNSIVSVPDAAFLAYDHLNVDLLPSMLTLDNGDSINFRFTVPGTTSVAGRLDNIGLSSAIPEPSNAVALAGVFAIGMSFRSRQRKS